MRGITTEDAGRRDAMLEAVAFAAQRFLEEPTWEDAVPEVLHRLGAATGASRAYVFETTNGPADEPLATQRFEWVAEGIEPQIDNARLRGTPWSNLGLARWVTVLAAGEVVQGHVRDLPREEREVLVEQDIRSLVEVPILVGGRWWGTIGFDDCLDEREWTSVEVDALRAAAGVMGAAIGRRATEDRLLEAERKYRALVERIPAVTYRETPDADPEGFYISPQVAELFGYDAETWRWTPDFWLDRLHPDDRRRVLEEDMAANEEGAYRSEYRFRAANGEYRWVHDEATLVGDATGGYWQGFILDITERKRAEARLLEAEARFRTLVEQVPVVIYTQEIDRHDPALTNTTYISPRVEELLGYTAAESLATGGLWREILHPDDRARVLEEDADGNTSGQPFAMEYRMIRKDGRVVWIYDEATLVTDTGGGPRYWQGFMLDITERKRAEERLAAALTTERDAASRLRTLDDMKNTFLQAVSHDLRTPLAAILGLAVTLEREDVGLSADDTRDLARRIAANARKLARMVTDLLDLDRLARGIVEPKSQPTDVGALVRRVLSDSELLSERDVRIEAPELVIATDGAKVERIVENLLANTARHTPRQSRVWIRVSPADPGALLVVEDDGPGIPEDLRDAIFEAFRQGPGASEHSPGVGVGLALVARFAELLGGRAWVEERPGGGASFRVFLADGVPDAAGDGPSPDAG